MPNKKKWSNEEIEILKEKYYSISNNDISKIINRTNDAIKIKARELNLKKNRSIFANWTKKEDEILINNYCNIKIDDIVKILNNKRDRNSIKNRAKRLKIIGNQRTRSINRRKLSFDENYFKEPNINNCYWAGYIAADGCILKNKVLDLTVSIKDKNVLEKFKNEIKFNGKIGEYLGKSKLCGDFIKCQLRITSKNIIDDLYKNWNIGGRKTFTLKEPSITITDNLAYSYIKGIIDGDGYIAFSKHGDKRYLILGICGTKEILEWIGKQFEIKFSNISYNIVKHYSIYKLIMSNKITQEIHKFLRYEIKNSFSLSRKWEIDYPKYKNPVVFG